MCAYFADAEVGVVRAQLDGSSTDVAVPSYPRPSSLAWRHSTKEIWWLDAYGSLRKSSWTLTASELYTLNSSIAYSAQTVQLLLQSPGSSPSSLRIDDSRAVAWWVGNSVFSASVASNSNIKERVQAPSGRVIKGLALDASCATLYFTSQSGTSTTLLHSVSVVAALAASSTLPGDSPQIATVTVSSLSSAYPVANIAVNGTNGTTGFAVYILYERPVLPQLMAIASASQSVTFTGTDVLVVPRDLAVFQSWVYVICGCKQFVSGPVSLSQLWRVSWDGTHVELLFDEAVASSRGGIAFDPSQGVVFWSNGRAIRAAPSTNVTNAVVVVEQGNSEYFSPLSLAVTPDGKFAYGHLGSLQTSDPDVAVSDQSGWLTVTYDLLSAVKVAGGGVAAAEWLAFHPDYTSCTAFVGSISSRLLQAVQFCSASPIVTTIVSNHNMGGVAADEHYVSGLQCHGCYAPVPSLSLRCASDSSPSCSCLDRCTTPTGQRLCGDAP